MHKYVHIISPQALANIWVINDNDFLELWIITVGIIMVTYTAF